MGAMLFAGATVGYGQSFSMQIVADNDFAVFAGTSNGVTELLYQNNFSWPDQIANLSSLNFTLQSGETTFYLLAMGGGGEENVSGTVNDVDITTISNVLMSSDISPSLTGYDLGAVAAGTYDASLADVQAVFSSLTWGAPSISSSDTVIQLASPNGVGFHFNDSTAHLFSFGATDVGVTPIPEPSTAYLLFASVGVVIAASRRRQHSPPRV